MFQVELVWNREFNFVPYSSPLTKLDDAIQLARKLENMSNGEAVKKTRITDYDGKIVWAYGKKV